MLLPGDETDAALAQHLGITEADFHPTANLQTALALANKYELVITAVKGLWGCGSFSGYYEPDEREDFDQHVFEEGGTSCWTVDCGICYELSESLEMAICRELFDEFYKKKVVG